MNGKGDKRRPMDVNQGTYESNWDRIFAKKEPQSLNEVAYDGMWQHSCTLTMQVVWVGKGEPCNYCGAFEENPNV